LGGYSGHVTNGWDWCGNLPILAIPVSFPPC